MKRFHVHIYFEPKELGLARALSERARFVDLFESVKFHEHPIGPHPTGMIELHFSELSYNCAVEWTKANRGIFSALVHHDTGDDLKDHTDDILWLGPKVQLDFDFFELIKVRPDLRVHQPL